MRPSILDPIFASVTSLSGVGIKVGLLMANLFDTGPDLSIPRIVNLVFHLPHSLIDRRNRPGIAFAVEGTIVTLELYIDRHQPPPRGNKRVPYRVFGHDESGEIALTFFRAQGNWLERALAVGEKVTVSGQVEWFNGRAAMVHPDYIVLADKAHELPLVEPIYGLTAGLSSKVLRKSIDQAVIRVPQMPEWIDPSLLDRHKFPTFSDAITQLHAPNDAAER